MQKTKCRICNEENENRSYIAREMMFGFLDKFIYFQCSNCGCLQIHDIPLNISKYYPPEYYSFKPLQASNSLKYRMKDYVIFHRNMFALSGKGFLGRLVYQKYPAEYLRAISKVGLTLNSKILDVGCGSGYLLHDLKRVGFKNLLGIDKYITKEFKEPVKIEKRDIQEVEGKWDLIIFNHSLEHMFDQLQTLQSVSKLLSENGVCLINLPIVSSFAWKKYGVNWFHLDAPRHFFLHSVESLKIVAGKANLVLRDVVYNSTGFSLLRSEQYSKGIPMNSNSIESIFSKAQIKSMAKKAKALNLNNEGDTAVFYFGRQKDCSEMDLQFLKLDTFQNQRKR